jgi:prepilin-type N-terminal cleavage/methylation domain-containing protein
MKIQRTSRSRRLGFSLVELLTAITIIGIVGGIAYISLVQTQRSSRDARRRTDITTILASVSQYYSSNGTSFIQDIDTTTKSKKPCAVASQTAEDPAVGTGCVGALGRAFGKISLRSTSTSTGYNGFSKRAYADTSIGDALVHSGYMTAVPRDPAAGTVAVTNSTERDYVLIRACRNGGHQAIGANGSIFAVWASLENAPATNDLTRSSKYPGGSSVVPVDPNSGTVYLYDFAAEQSEFLAGYYSTYGYAVGNGGAQTLSDAANCAGNSIENSGA